MSGAFQFATCNEPWKDVPIEEVFSRVARIGFDGVELAPFTLAPDVREISASRRKEIVRAAADAGVKIVGRFPENSHPPIVYPAAMMVKTKPDAQKFFQFLLSGTALVFFERYGFTYLVKAGP